MQPRPFGDSRQMGMFGPHRAPRGPHVFGGFPAGMRPPQGMNRSGGLLSSLFQRQTPAQTGLSPAGMFSRAPQTGGGFLQGLTNPGNIQSFLNNTQQVIKTAQQIGPMVQQYGPLVKNLPAMWKLYKGFTANQDESNETKQESKELPSSGTFEDSIESSSEDLKPVKNRPSGESVPKLYI
ncbi:VrrA/YqfQ family protein [Siminovitchia sediminis]|uniref:VrrA/YqfQ family protein n=1 Tax=Siminovitchia sediminis TaxID=1274353 RepID=A0ABW4KB48_9BACI